LIYFSGISSDHDRTEEKTDSRIKPGRLNSEPISGNFFTEIE